MSDPLDIQITKPIVFTNGVFDILHEGHVRLLEYCGELAEQQKELDYRETGNPTRWKVIVGINSDHSVKRIKGTHRPVVPLRSRVAVLSALCYVDDVIPFDEDTPERLIEDLRPTFLVKGNFTGPMETLPGYGLVPHVRILGCMSELSTSHIIRRAAGAAWAEPFYQFGKLLRSWSKK